MPASPEDTAPDMRGWREAAPISRRQRPASPLGEIAHGREPRERRTNRAHRVSRLVTNGRNHRPTW